MTLPQTTIDRIGKEAKEYAAQFKHGDEYRRLAYADGATAEANRALPVYEALLKFIIRHEAGMLPNRVVCDEGLAAIASYESGEAVQAFSGSVTRHPMPGVQLACISPQASDLLKTIMEAWELWLEGLKEVHGPDFAPSIYGFAYWLVRYSGLAQPSGADPAQSPDPAILVKALEDAHHAMQLAKTAIERTNIYATKDGIWINSRVKGSAMFGLQGAEPEFIESFEISAKLNRTALEAIDKVLKPKPH